MRKNENGLQWIVTETAQKKLHFPWGAWVVCAVLTVGFCLLLTAAFPSVPYPWWAMTAAAILVQAALLIVYQTRIGNWLVPAGIGVLLLLSLALNKFVLPGFGTLANDFLTLQAADAVEKLIDAIGTVTLDSEEAIKAARDAYDALTEAQKAQVGNYQTLLDAEAKLAQLKKDAEKPSQPEQPAKPGEDANKPATGDAGVALWLTVMCMTSLLGAALVGKKRKA